MEQQARGRIPELDGLRAFAVAAVVLDHILADSGRFSLPPWLYQVALMLGSFGVNVFFVISGFIITTLILRERAKTGTVSLTSFYLRRFFRIIPPFAAFLVVLVAVRAFGSILLPNADLWLSFLFLGDAQLFSANAWFVGHTWSLAVEEQFYLIFPPLLCLVFRFRERPLAYALAATYLLCVLSLRIADRLHDHVDPRLYSVAGLIYFRYIIVGVVLAIYGQRVLRRLADTPRWVALLLALGMFALNCVSGRNILALSALFVEPFVCGLFVMWFSQNPSRCAPLRWSVIQWLGRCSYSIYLWQQFFIGPASFYRGWSLPLPVALAGILACAAISYYLIELPSIRLGRYFSSHEAGGALKT